jgi:uncharacterized damage-inducible protein DinB
MLRFYEEIYQQITNWHAQIDEILDSLPSEALDWQPAPDTNSIAVLVAHISGAERFLVGDIVMNQPSGRDRNGEFRTLNLGSADLKALLRKSEAALRQALEPLSLDDLEVERLHPARQSMVSIGWAVTHALEHTAGHTGEIQLARHVWLKGIPPNKLQDPHKN